jgi:hypothetical protein
LDNTPPSERVFLHEPDILEVKTMRSRITIALAVCALALAPSVAQAGPPLLCFPMSIGDATSLPWGASGWKSPLASYDRARLADDTVALLSSQSRTLVRMETLRRAVIYAAENDAAATRLFAALRARTATKGGKAADPATLFDLGYAVEAFRQTKHGFSSARLVDPPEDGYALIRQAIEARGPDPEMEYAAALVTTDRMFKGVSNDHLRAAAAGAKKNADLARTIAAHEPMWGSRLAELNGK